jgi:hypothetical protein
MKKELLNYKSSLLFLFIGVMIFAFVPPKYSLVGKWSILNPDGTPSGEYVNFKEDNTYTVALPNGQIGERGNYFLKDSVFSIQNIKDVCGKGYWGKYNLTFYGIDSVHFALIEDSCSERRMDMVGYNPGLKRYRTK